MSQSTSPISAINALGAQSLEALKQGLPCGRLVLKLAATSEEREAVFKLRYRVFNEEMGEGLPENAKTGLDVDSFDDHCDHLMVLSKNRVVGTYRLLYGPNRPAKGFYTQTEFNLDKLALDLDHAVELGRGCIEAEHRKQTTLMALFWGLHRYTMCRHARYLLGCASLPIMSHDNAEATFAELVAQGQVDLQAQVQPLQANAFAGNAQAGTPSLPALIGFYLEFGARILGRPAFDPIFKCHDMLMVFDMDHLSGWGSELLLRFDRRLLNSSQNSEES